jgi:hypothetical protein
MMRRIASINTDEMQLITLPPIGQERVKRFVKHHSGLKTVYSTNIDLARWKETTSEAINKWFDAFESTRRSHNFETCNIYTMDETGFAIGTSQCSRVIIYLTMRTRYKLEPGRQKWV